MDEQGYTYGVFSDPVQAQWLLRRLMLPEQQKQPPAEKFEDPPPKPMIKVEPQHTPQSDREREELEKRFRELLMPSELSTMLHLLAHGGLCARELHERMPAILAALEEIRKDNVVEDMCPNREPRPSL